jgi:hypothetical protein
MARVVSGGSLLAAVAVDAGRVIIFGLVGFELGGRFHGSRI